MSIRTLSARPHCEGFTPLDTWLPAWVLVCCGLLIAPATRAQVLEQDQEHGAVWISAQEHQRVIAPKLSKPVQLDVSAQRDEQNAAPDAVVEQLLTTHPRKVARPKGAKAPRLTEAMLEMLQRASLHFAVDAHLVKAVIHAESAFNPYARSPKNAIGLMQVLPGTARDLGLQDLQGMSVEQLLTDPRVSIVLGTKYLAEQLARFGGNVELAVAAYNAGPGAVVKAGHRVPNYPETRQYVRRVLSLAQTYRRTGLQGAPA